MKQIRYCKLCGEVITTKNNNYCSVKCFNMDRGRNTYTCKYCGVSFTPKAADRTIYCSRDCYFAEKTKKRLVREEQQRIDNENKEILYIECSICGALFIKKRKNNTSLCSTQCQAEHNRRMNLIYNKKKKEEIVQVLVCKECKKEFIPEYGDKRKKFCSKKCNRRFMSRDKGKYNRHRARKLSVPYEPISCIKVFDRDGWICQICGKSTPKKNRGTLYTNAPELDHRIPMSKGGGHLYSNVQCACRKCNSIKSNLNCYGQLPLFGVGTK